MDSIRCYKILEVSKSTCILIGSSLIFKDIVPKESHRALLLKKDIYNYLLCRISEGSNKRCTLKGF